MTDVPFYYIYGVPVDAAEMEAIHIERVGDRIALHDGSVEAHCHPHLYQISLWRGEGGRYCIAGQWHALPEGALTIIPPGVTHGFEITPPTDAMVISVSAAFLAELKARQGGEIWPVFDSAKILALSPEAEMRLLSLFRAVEEEYRFSSRHSGTAIVCHLQLIAILAERLIGMERPGAAISADERLLAAFLQLVDGRLNARWSVEQYVEALGTTAYLLNRVTRDAMGRTAIEIVRDRTIAEAKRLLLFSKAGASEIGYLLGFGDPAHFGRFFRRGTGLSPAEWRKRQIAKSFPV